MSMSIFDGNLICISVPWRFSWCSTIRLSWRLRGYWSSTPIIMALGSLHCRCIIRWCSIWRWWTTIRCWPIRVSPVRTRPIRGGSIRWTKRGRSVWRCWCSWSSWSLDTSSRSGSTCTSTSLPKWTSFVWTGTTSRCTSWHSSATWSLTPTKKTSCSTRKTNEYQKYDNDKWNTYGTLDKQTQTCSMYSIFIRNYKTLAMLSLPRHVVVLVDGMTGHPHTRYCIHHHMACK